MRSRHPSYVLFATAGLLVLAGCSKGEDQPAETTEAAADAAQPATAAPAAREAVRAAGSNDAAQVPDISQAAAPGVAFSYRYAFALPAKAIAGVQQEHAATCERLGPARC